MIEKKHLKLKKNFTVISDSLGVYLQNFPSRKSGATVTNSHLSISFF